MDLSIIVVNWNTRELLRQCLRSIHATIGTSAIEFEILVVDNASVDGSADMVASEFPDAHLINNTTNVGFAKANNQAVRVARGKCVLLLNSDAVLLPGAVSAMLRVFEQQPEVAIVGAQLLNPDGTFQGSFADFPSLTGELLLATRLARFVYSAAYPNYPAEQSQAPRSVDWVSGACLMARAAAIADVGPLDEDYFMYTEETDWCYRMRRAGWLVFYEPGAKVIHFGSQSSKRVPERRRSMIYQTKWLFMRKHRGRFAAEVFRGALLVVSALKLVLWATRGLRADPTRRGLARQHVRSYERLLLDLARATA